MKKVILVLFVNLLILPLSAQFSADLANVQPGDKRIYKVHSNGTKYRYDFEEDGMKGAVIVDPAANQTAILYPDKKYVRYVETSSPFSGMMDPNQGFKQMQQRFTPKDAGSETMLGYKVKKLEIYAGEDKIVTGWYSEDLGFLVKMIKHGRENDYMELTNIKKGKIDDSLFKIPEDYIEVDDQMRIKIPEPPPPESWNSIELNLPIKGDYKRGDNISFSIPENKSLHSYSEE